MRYRLMASFQGASYQAGVGPTDEEVTLFAACPPPEELGFRSSSNHWRKRVGVDEIDALWEARPIGRDREERGEYELALLPAMGSGNGLGWSDGSVPTWAHTPREYGGPAPDTGPLRTV